MLMKNPMTPAGIEPMTFVFVAQQLKHCATAVPCGIRNEICVLRRGYSFPRLTSDSRLFFHNILPWNVVKLCCILFLLYSYLDLVYLYYLC